MRLQQDINNDGLVDLFIAKGHFIEIGLKHDGHILRREITIGGGHAGGSLGWHHFGVGKDTDVEFRVIWPDGEADDWQTVAADGLYWVSPKKTAVKWE